MLEEERRDGAWTRGYIWEAAGALPGRGARGLVAAGGESVQQKEKSRGSVAAPGNQMG
jgi:hypothetical protein